MESFIKAALYVLLVFMLASRFGVDAASIVALLGSAGVAIGLTYGKSLEEACRIGTRLASSVISTKENVCPRFMPEEFDLKID